MALNCCDNILTTSSDGFLLPYLGKHTGSTLERTHDLGYDK